MRTTGQDPSPALGFGPVCRRNLHNVGRVRDAVTSGRGRLSVRSFQSRHRDNLGPPRAAVLDAHRREADGRLDPIGVSVVLDFVAGLKGKGGHDHVSSREVHC